MADISHRPVAEAVAASAGTLSFSVTAGGWDGRLPDELSALIAPPIVVSVARIAPAPAAAAERRRAELMLYRMNMPMLSPALPRPGRHRRHARIG